MRRAEEVRVVGEVRRHLADHPGPADADAVRPHPLGDPQPLAAGELDHHPALAGVGDQVRVAAVGGLAVALDQLADQLDALARRARPLQHDARQVAVVQPALVGRRHRPQPLGAGRPDVAHGDAVLVEAAVGQRRGDAAVVRVVDPQVAGGDRRLRDRGAHAGHQRRLGDADLDRSRPPDARPAAPAPASGWTARRRTRPGTRTRPPSGSRPRRSRSSRRHPTAAVFHPQVRGTSPAWPRPRSPRT